MLARRNHWLPLFVGLLMAFAVHRADSQSESGIAGIVLTSPTTGGPVRAGETDETPMKNAEFVIRAKDQPIAKFVTDEHGRFRVLLAPGTYQVATARGKPGFGACGPFEINVKAGHVQEVCWRCDSGLR